VRRLSTRGSRMLLADKSRRLSALKGHNCCPADSGPKSPLLARLRLLRESRHWGARVFKAQLAQRQRLLESSRPGRGFQWEVPATFLPLGNNPIQAVVGPRAREAVGSFLEGEQRGGGREAAREGAGGAKGGAPGTERQAG